MCIFISTSVNIPAPQPISSILIFSSGFAELILFLIVLFVEINPSRINGTLNQKVKIIQLHTNFLKIIQHF